MGFHTTFHMSLTPVTSQNGGVKFVPWFIAIGLLLMDSTFSVALFVVLYKVVVARC